MSSSSHLNHIHTFFTAYPSFTYNSSAPSASEFRRLCAHKGWAKGAAEQKKAWKDFQIALAKQFNKVYGSDADNLKAWQRLYSTLHFSSQKEDPDGGPLGVTVPETLKDVREAVLKVYANPVDLIEGFKGSKKVETFADEAELAAYSSKTGKIIWPSTPGAGPLLKMLLNPRDLVLKDLERTIDHASLSHPNPNPNPILIFFSSYAPSFTYTPTASSGAASEFRRLCEHKRWEKGDPEQKAAWRGFQDALARQFNSLYGVEVDNLKLWQRVCSQLKIEPLPTTLEDAQEAVFNTHFNVVDLIEGCKGAREIKIFESDIELAEYSKRSGKIISESSPAAGALLLAILRGTTYGPLDRPSKLKPWKSGKTDKKGKNAKAVPVGPSRKAGLEETLEEGEGRRKDKARSTTRKQLVQCSVERAGAFMGLEDVYDWEDLEDDV